MTKVLNDSKVKMTIVHDYETVNTYIVAMTQEYVGHYYDVYNEDHTLKHQFFVLNTENPDKDGITKAKFDNKIIIMVKGTTKVTAIRFERASTGFDNIIYYSLQQATDAGLYYGFHSYLKDNSGKPVFVPGRVNWNSHPAVMVRNRVRSHGANIVVADKLLGNYSVDEMMEILNIDEFQSE